MILGLAVALAAGPEMAAPAPGALPTPVAPVPTGPPRVLRASPGDALAAIVATLPAGSRLVLAPGEHPGPLVVDRPMTLEGEPGAALVGPGKGTVLTVVAPDVVVRDLAVRRGGDSSILGDAGIAVGGDRVRIERVEVSDTYLGIDLRRVRGGAIVDCVVRGWADLPLGRRGDGIRLWEAHDVVVTGNTLLDVRDMVAWFSSGNRIEGNRVERGRYGVHLMFANDNAIVGNHLVDDVVGAFVMYSAEVRVERNELRGARGSASMGLGVKESSGLLVRDNRFVDDTIGIYVDMSPQVGEARFEANLIAYDHVGVSLHGVQPGLSFLGNTFLENRVQVEDDRRAGGGVTFEGNAWSDYVGYDLDQDGYGDLPYEVRARTAGLAQRRPAAAFFDGTLAAALVDLVGRAFPMFRAGPLHVDPRPWGGA